ncbi:bifunctional NAD(P)/FAD-dependent oxidoreductase/class I SAM-dependent methyltransferase [Actinoplanes sp. NEAU-A12]|uniref:Bifunctional NAD(P)/FAD-dependent oxidoreductase/class I SAM-dependent methyltransferase n=1 Tax=Actinoplanes sandaracinus TaxID=3045177 RepID=A0ABT6WMJ9_9ACTN|nr:bifunctional NAD(P)/FAD-dependent oxidoreductase/class I SAM-dependent methyltransferase [Actinoplanes sandaracinus]MDI6100967.1 bifunctional NAD(P)/FAD-dependent oxidoreductase/class I SAM-dependent methyltransferase [Actinoplanes sandaracinus]
MHGGVSDEKERGTPVEEQTYDVVVVGGGAAGLSGALALARSRRSVLVLDSGEPRNAPAAHMHNFLGRDGVPPGELLADGRDELAGYGVEVVTARAGSAVRDDAGFRVELEDGRAVRGRRLLVTTGLVDELPAIPGLAGRWGRDVAHCPYCHGWELRDQRIGVIASGPLSVHQAQMWRQISPHVLLLLNGGDAPAAEQGEELAARGVPVVPGAIESVEVAGDRLTGVRLADGDVVAVDAVVVGPRFTARSGVLEALGLVAEPFEMHGHRLGSRIPADESGATSVPGVWVAGNVTNLGATVAVAVAGGQTAGAAINMDLIAEDTRAAVAAYRNRIATMFTEDAWEERYRGKDAVWSGRPNPVLVDEVSGLAVGRALDVGCGEGADAVWLAGRGWQVTAVDISSVALGRAAGHAADAGLAERITFRHADLRTDEPGEGYDLVSAQFMHLPPDARRELYTRLAASVGPGGTLLVVGHHPSDLATSVGRMHFPDMLFTAEEIAGLLEPGGWKIVTAEARPRTVTDPQGREITIHDAVLVAQRQR